MSTYPFANPHSQVYPNLKNDSDYVEVASQAPASEYQASEPLILWRSNPLSWCIDTSYQDIAPIAPGLCEDSAYIEPTFSSDPTRALRNDLEFGFGDSCTESYLGTLFSPPPPRNNLLKQHLGHPR